MTNLNAEYFFQTLRYAAITSLLGLALCLALGVGPYKPFLALVEICFLLYFLHALFAKKNIPILILYVLVIPIVFFGLHYFVSDTHHHKESERNLVAFMAIAGLIPFLNLSAHLGAILRQIILFLIMSISLMQSFAIIVFKSPFGFFNNPHLACLFVIMVIILGVYYFLTNSKKHEIYVAYFLILNSLILLFYFSSWVGLCSLLGSVIIMIISKSNRNFYIVTWCLLVFLIGVLLSVDFSRSGNAEIENIVNSNSFSITDERLIIWKDSWQMQLESSRENWFFGHGFGGFRNNFSNHSSFNNTISFVFPHNFILEILYNNGILALLIFLTGFIHLILKLQKKYRSSQDIIFLLAIALLVSVFIFGFLTLPLLSKYNSYSLAFVTGFCVWVIMRRVHANE